MLRKIITLIMCAALVLSVASCGESNEVASDKIRVTMSFWEPGVNQEFETAFKEIITEYNKVRPDVQIELISQPYDGYQQWITSQFSANSAPIIEYNHSATLADQFRNGLLLDLREVLSQPNKYAGDEAWADTFIDGRLDPANNYTSDRFSIPIQGMGLAFFYNKAVYDELGLTPPATWDEFMANCAKIAETPTNPIALMGMKDDAIDWLAQYITTGLFGNYILADDKINFNGDTALDDKEIVRAIKEGHFDITTGEYNKMYKKLLDMVAEYSEYTKDAVGLDEVGAKAQFVGGKAAHIMSGSWDIPEFINNDERDFEVSAFPFPKFTKDNYEHAGGSMVVIGVQPFAITSKAKENPEVEEAAKDFLQFMTAPANYKIFVERTLSIPVVKDVDVDSIFTSFTEGTRPPLFLFVLNSKLAAFNGKDAVKQVLSGKKDGFDDMAKKQQESIDMWADESIERFGISAETNYDTDSVSMIGVFDPEN